MKPSFVPGDHVVTFRWTKIRPGDVVVFKFGFGKHIKRVTKVTAAHFCVEGENKLISAKYSEIKKEDLLGKVLFKY